MYLIIDASPDTESDDSGDDIDFPNQQDLLLVGDANPEPDDGEPGLSWWFSVVGVLIIISIMAVSFWCSMETERFPLLIKCQDTL